MEITREQLEVRKAELDETRQRALAAVNGCMGAIEDCDHWLSILDATAEEKPEVPLRVVKVEEAME